MSTCVLVATRKGLIEVVRSASGWAPGALHFAGEPVSSALFDARDGTTYAALNLGHFGVKLHRREAGASDWTEVAVPVYPPEPAEKKEEYAWKLLQIWTLAAGGKDEPGTLWAGTLPGGLFRSRDRGASWELIDSLWNTPTRVEWFGGGYDTPGIHSVNVDPRDSRHVFASVSCGGVWETKDGGASWNLATRGMRANYMPPERAEEGSIQDPHRVAMCDAAPDTLWCQHHGGIFRSADGGANWSGIKPEGLLSDFGFAVAAHPRDPLTAWFAPAVADQKRLPVDFAMCVTRTRDGGKSFEVLRRGLPQKDCYDLVYRHGLAVADDGKTLAMASTTGGLWLSDDAGDSWQAVSNTLPPIYTVTFA